MSLTSQQILLVLLIGLNLWIVSRLISDGLEWVLRKYHEWRASKLKWWDRPENNR